MKPHPIDPWLGPLRNAGAGAAVLPVPMHAARLRKRGLSLAAEAARIVSETWGIPLLSGMLIKARRTPPQVRLARADRLENVKESFAVSSAEEIHGKILLVVDDVATTGATLNECARTLKEAGARRVYALTLARQP